MAPKWLNFKHDSFGLDIQTSIEDEIGEPVSNNALQPTCPLAVYPRAAALVYTLRTNGAKPDDWRLERRDNVQKRDT